MNNFYKNSVLYVLCIAAFIAKSQSLRPLSCNPVLIQHNTLHKDQHALNRVQAAGDTLEIPFFDDFSYEGPYPNDTLWQNSQSVYVNRTKAVAPPNLGVATFDGLNKYGYPYNTTSCNLSSSSLSSCLSLPSDTLTSKPIHLEGIPSLGLTLSPADSIFFSFYYQPMGQWEAPEPTDELILEFHSPLDSGIWQKVWSHNGYQSASQIDSNFHLVNIPITDNSYFQSGFQFRFRNKSAACGDVDHWHIDWVKLDYHRSISDTIFPDISFVYDLKSPLKNYTQMPYNQFSGADDMRDSIAVVFRNNNNIKANGSYYNPQAIANITTAYRFADKTGIAIASDTNGTANVYCYDSVGYCNNKYLMHPSLNGFTYNTGPLSAMDTFNLSFYLLNRPDAFHIDDTIRFQQCFSNYFAYDDGSAEAAFAITGQGDTNAMVAVKYVLNAADTLQAVDMFFDPVFGVAEQKAITFHLAVWADANGKPGGFLQVDSNRTPYFPVDSLVPSNPYQRNNTYQRYQLKQPLFLDSGTVFYVGYIQVYNAGLDIGYDVSNDFHSNMFYRTSNPCCPDWYHIYYPGSSALPGSLMIRPVLGPASLATGIEEIHRNDFSFIVFPNPASDNVSYRCNISVSRIVVCDLLGNIVLEPRINAQSIDTRSLSSGAYIVKACTPQGYISTQKLIISK